MNDSTSTPDESEGHGSLATGGQPGASANGARGEAGNGTPEHQPPAPGADGAGDEVTVETRALGGTPEADTAPVATGVSVPSTAGSPAGGGEQSTTELWFSAPVNGGSSASEPRPVSRPAAQAPVPAPGPVPNPGPSAATPPPWNRVPGPDSREPETVTVPRGGPAGGLLDDEPTTFLQAPHAGHDGGQEGGDPAVWSAARPVRSRAPRQAALQLKRLDPWSVLKLALVLAVVLFLVWLVAVGVLYGVLSGMGVWDRLNGTYADLVSGDTPTGSPLISAGRVFALAAVVGAINSLLFAVAMTVGAFVYNVAADLVGGIEVTLSERD